MDEIVGTIVEEAAGVLTAIMYMSMAASFLYYLQTTEIPVLNEKSIRTTNVQLISDNIKHIEYGYDAFYTLYFSDQETPYPRSMQFGSAEIILIDNKFPDKQVDYLTETLKNVFIENLGIESLGYVWNRELAKQKIIVNQRAEDRHTWRYIVE